MTHLNRHDGETVTNFILYPEKILKVSIYKCDLPIQNQYASMFFTLAVLCFGGMYFIDYALIDGILAALGLSSLGISFYHAAFIIKSYFFHHFVVFETETKFIAVEKSSNGIHVATANKDSDIFKANESSERKPKCWARDRVKKGVNTNDILHWLNSTEQSKLGYDYLNLNCGKFASDVFNEFAATKKVCWKRHCWEELKKKPQLLNAFALKKLKRYQNSFSKQLALCSSVSM